MHVTIFTIIASCHLFTVAHEYETARINTRIKMYNQELLNHGKEPDKPPIVLRNRLIERVLLICPGFTPSKENELVPNDKPKYLLDIKEN
jgi:hypothetical protein|tara:strand:- start:1861 stop:2130 length:270 start_codon:yes stop_codon:yes gene_type:complete